MLNYIYQALILFRKVFSHRSTWLIFCMVTLGFIGSREMQGVTSLCRFWGLGPNGYYMFLHFFRVSSWSLDALIGCFAAHERFVMTGAIALGLMQLISLKFGQSVWQRFSVFLRTRSRMLPSERTVKHVVANLLVQNLINLAPDAMIREIQKQCRNKKAQYQRANSPPELKQPVFEAEETV